MKKWLIVVSVLVVLLGGGAGYWYSKKQPSVISDPIDAIPVTASLVLSFPDLHASVRSLSEQDYHKVLSSIDLLAGWLARQSDLDSVLFNDTRLQEVLGGTRIWLAYEATATDSLHQLWILSGGNGTEERLTDIWKQHLASSGAAITEQMLGESKVYRAVRTDPFEEAHFTVKNGLLLIASSSTVLRTSLQQLDGGTTLRSDANFMSAVETAGKNVDMNIYVHYPQLPAYLKGVLKSETSSVDAMLSQFADWSEFDLNFKSSGLTFNGFTYVQDSMPQFLSIFEGQEPQAIRFPEFVPSNTASFVFFGFDDVIALSSNYRALLSKQGKLNRFESVLDSVNGQLSVDLEQNLLAWLGNGMGVCVSKPASQSFAEDSYLVFEARSVELADKLLGDLAILLSERSGRVAEPLEVGGVQIRELALDGTLEQLFGTAFSQYQNPHFAILNGFVVFGTSAASVGEYVRYVQADRTLGKDLSFARFAEDLGSTYSMFSYNHLWTSQKIFESYLNRDAVKAMERNREHIYKFEAFATQFTVAGNSFYSSAFLKYNPTNEDRKESHWIAQMDAAAVMAPVFVKNHISGEPEILVQDESNHIYLFNQLGQQLFKTEIKEPIQSRPVQVDAFKNGKLQYVFNTKNFIYLIDRDGNMVDGFPVELTSPAETDLAVFDYDNDKDYRLLISCKNNHIYNFNIKGKVVSGWAHDRSSDPTVHPFKHMLVAGKDYIVTGESNGKIHLLDRRGKNRVKVENRIPSSKNNHLELFKAKEGKASGVYLTDSEGRIQHVALNGAVQQIDLGKFSPEHYFFVRDLDGDQNPEFIFSDLNLLQVFNYRKEKMFEARMEPGASAPFFLPWESGTAIGLCYPESEQLILMDGTGQVVRGFPVPGVSPFDMVEYEDKLLLVTAAPEGGLLIQNLR